jgi:hypothetical protein
LLLVWSLSGGQVVACFFGGSLFSFLTAFFVVLVGAGVVGAVARAGCRKGEGGAGLAEGLVVDFLME